MQSIRAIYDGNIFTPIQPVPIKGNCEVIITFLESAEKDTAHINQSEKLPRSGALGLWRGKVRMADDFNEPLEEMKEYM